MTVEGKDDPLPGTIWVALYNDARGNPGGLAVLEPARRNTGPWTTLAGTGSPRQEVSYVAYGGRLFLAGGGTRQQVFDPRTGTWSDVAPLPESLDHIQGAVVGDKIYYVGGLRSWPNDEVGTVYVYDPASNRFSRGPTMPRPRGAGGVAVHDGKIYYAGGLHRGRAVPWLDVLDPATGHWSQLPDMPRPRDHFQAVFAGDRMLVTGGRNRDIGTEIADTDAYDVSERRWVTGLAPLPTPRGGFGAVFVHGEMLVIGGEVPGRVLPTVEAYDVARDTWRTLPSMPTARHGIQAALCGDRVLVAAGGIRMGGGPSDAHEALAVGPKPCGHEAATPEPHQARSLAGSYVLGSVADGAPLRPTSLQVGPDGRLYVAQQNGTIRAYTVRRRAAGAFEVTASESIDLVRAIRTTTTTAALRPTSARSCNSSETGLDCEHRRGSRAAPSQLASMVDQRNDRSRRPRRDRSRSAPDPGHRCAARARRRACRGAVQAGLGRASLTAGRKHCSAMGGGGTAPASP